MDLVTKSVEEQGLIAGAMRHVCFLVIAVRIIWTSVPQMSSRIEAWSIIPSLSVSASLSRIRPFTVDEIFGRNWTQVGFLVVLGDVRVIRTV